MKEYIIQALFEANAKLERQTPETKKEPVYLDITDVSPKDLAKFMKYEKVPEDAHFWGKPNGDDSLDYPVLYFEIDVPTTDRDKLTYKRRVFQSLAFSIVSHDLLLVGYKRKGFNSGLLKEFDDTTVYDMYIQEEFDRLVKYYSLFFEIAG